MSVTTTNGGGWEGKLVVKHQNTAGSRTYLGAMESALKKVIINCFQSKHLVGAFSLSDIEE